MKFFVSPFYLPVLYSDSKWFYCSSLSPYTQQPDPVERWCILFLCFPPSPQYQHVSSSNAITFCQSCLHSVPTASRLNSPRTRAHLPMLKGPEDFLFPEENFQISNSQILPFVLVFSFNASFTASCSCQSGYLCSSSWSVPHSHDTIPPLPFKMLTSSHHSGSSLRLRLSLPRKLPRLPHDSSFLIPRPFSKYQKSYCVCH